jgi:protein-tyrosine phosphatase
MRHIALGGAHNYRDLGGLETADGSTPFGRFIRGESPHNLTPEALETLLTMGVNTVIDLRSAAEVNEHPNPLASHDQVAYHHIPLFAALEAFGNSQEDKSFPPLEMIYIGALELCKPAFAQVLQAAHKANGTTLLHCVAGKDRTGLVSMLLAAQMGATEAALLEDYALTEQAVPLLERLRHDAAKNGYDMTLFSSILSAKPETMQAALAHLEQKYGGIQGYIQSL